MADKEFVEQLHAGHAFRSREGCHFGKHDDGSVGILVAQEVGSEVSLAFLTTENEESGMFQTQVACLDVGEVTIVCTEFSGDLSFVFS